MSRSDAVGLWWQDVHVEKLRGAGPKLNTKVYAIAPENGLGFPRIKLNHTCKEKAYVEPKPQAIMDIECYSNYFLVMFMRMDEVVIGFERTETEELDVVKIRDIVTRYEIITFNGNNYDIPMLNKAFSGATNAELKSANDDIIYRDVSPYQFDKKHRLRQLQINTIDLIEIAPGMVSLKIYGGRLHCKELQDLPLDPEQPVPLDQIPLIRKYCTKDLSNTKLLLTELVPQIQLRRNMSNEYRIDLRSKSDAQIAEAVLTAEITRSSGQRLPKISVYEKQFLYQLPPFIQTDNPQLWEAIEIITEKPFTVTKTGRIEMPKELLMLQIKIGNSTYQMGMGGLHSTESCVHHLQDDIHLICDYDVASYYPSIILNCELYPNQLGRVFLDVYKKLVDVRLAAKATGDKVKADSLKICVNGSFGKLGSPYSVLYAPELMVQVTVTGQLALLMLIDSLESRGISVVSANTDGVVIKCSWDRETVLIKLIEQWQEQTGFVMERSDYRAIYSRDVNNYIAVRPSGDIKAKGYFKVGDISKNPTNEICNLALVEFLKSGKPFIETIQECDDICRFISLRHVKGGAVKGSEYLGKAVRFYYAKGVKGTINYQSNGNTVPRTEGAKPIMDLPDVFPGDVNYEWYVQECVELLKQLGLKTAQK